MDILALLHSPDFQTRVIAGLLTALVGAAFRYLTPAARVVWGTSHGFSFTIPQQTGPPVALNTRSFFVKNVGRAAATGLEIHFNYKPEHLQIWPAFTYTTATNPENHHCVQIDNLGRREWLSIEVASMGLPLPHLLRVRTHQGECKEVPLAPMQIMPRWVHAIVWMLILAGVFWVFETVVAMFR